MNNCIDSVIIISGCYETGAWQAKGVNENWNLMIVKKDDPGIS